MEKNKKINRRGSPFEIMISLGFLAIFVAMAIFGAIYLDISFLIGFCIGGITFLLLFLTWIMCQELIESREPKLKII